METIQVQITEQVSPKNVATVDNPSLSLTGNVYNKEQTDSAISKVTTNAIKGEALTTTSPTAWTTGSPDLFEKWDVRTTGTFTNFKNSSNTSIIVTQNDLDNNYVQFWVSNGVASKVLSQKIQPDSAKLEKWTAKSYTEGAQVFKNGFVYGVKIGQTATAADVPSETSEIWEVLVNGGNISDTFDINNATKAVSAKSTNDYFWDGHDELVSESDFEALPNTPWNNFNSVSIPGVRIVSDYGILDHPQTINQIQIYGQNNSVEIFTTNEAYGDFKTIQTIPLNYADGLVLKTIPVDFTLPAGRRLGIRPSHVIGYKTGGGHGGWQEGYGHAPHEWAYGYSSVVQVLRHFDGIIKQEINDVKDQHTEDIQAINSQIVDLVASSSTGKTSPIVFFEDRMTSQNAKWLTEQPGAWSFGSGSWKNNINNFKLVLANYHIFYERKMVMRIKPSADTNFYLEVTNGAFGSSLFSINFATGKISIFGNNSEVNGNTANSVDTILKASADFTYISGRQYIVELTYDKSNHIISLIDIVSGKKTTVEYDNWGAGRQLGYYSFYVKSGGKIEISYFKVSTLKPYYEVIFSGDSITEGVGVTDKSKRYYEIMKNWTDKTIGQLAIAGETGAGFLIKMDFELSYLKPKKLFITLGTNSATEAEYQGIKTKALSMGIQPIFNYIPAMGTSAFIERNNTMVAAVGASFTGYRFDLATTTNNVGTSQNGSLFSDGLHPNDEGNEEMAKRFWAEYFLLND